MRFNKARVETGNEAKHTHTHEHAHIHSFLRTKTHPHTHTHTLTPSSPSPSTPTRIRVVHLEDPPPELHPTQLPQSHGGMSGTAKLQVAKAGENRMALSVICNEATHVQAGALLGGLATA